MSAISRDRLVDRVEDAAADRAAGRRDVDGLGGEPRSSSSSRASVAAALGEGAPRSRRGPRSRRPRPWAGPRRAARRSRAGPRSGGPSCPGRRARAPRASRRVGGRGDRAPAPRRGAPRGRGSGSARSTCVLACSGITKPSTIVTSRARAGGRVRCCQVLGALGDLDDRPNVAASRTARSARILRSSSISAFLRPATNWP